MAYSYKLIFNLLKTLATPFNKTKAYKLGIIDAEGNVLKRHKELETFAEKNAYSNFERIIFNIKKLIEKVPLSDLDLKKNPVMRVLHPQLNKGITNVAKASYYMLQENAEYNKTKTFAKFAWEDLEEMVNVTTGIAGLPPDDPPVSKSAQKKHRKKNKKKKKLQRWITFKEFERLSNGNN